MNRQIYKDIPPQELKEKWFKSHLLGKEVELSKYEMNETLFNTWLSDLLRFSSRHIQIGSIWYPFFKKRLTIAIQNPPLEATTSRGPDS